MRALVQRVRRAAVRVEDRQIAAIGPGLLVLLGVTHDDTGAQADRLADKLRALRVFPDAEGRMNEPLGDREVLCVSQFTLYGDARKGNRPSYVDAARPDLRRLAGTKRLNGKQHPSHKILPTKLDTESDRRAQEYCRFGNRPAEARGTCCE